MGGLVLGLGLGLTSSAGTPTPTPTVRTLLVGNRMGSPSWSNATDPGYGGAAAADGGISFRSRMDCAPSDGGYYDLQVAYGANIERLTGTVALGNALNFKSAFEQSGSFYTVDQGGNRTIAVADGDFEFSDAQATFAPAGGSTFYVRSYLSVLAGGRLYFGLGTATTGDFYRRNGVVGATFTAGADIVDATGTTNFGAQGTSPQPLFVIGKTTDATVKAVLLVANSIGSGEGDGVGSALAYRGYVERQLASNVNWAWGSGRGSGHLFDLITSGAANCVRGLPYATSCIEVRWLNDIYISGRTTTQVKQAILDWALFAKGVNPDIANFTATATPQTTGTYTSVGGQTINNTTRNTQRTDVNDWIRDGLPMNSPANTPAAIGATSGVVRSGEVGHPHTGWFEVADLVEADASGALTRNGSLWYCGPANNTAYTADGNHPNGVGHAAMAPGIVLADLV